MQNRLHKLLWASLYAFCWLACLSAVAVIVLVVKAQVFDTSTRELEQAATIEKRLPQGCKLVDLGAYGNIQKIIAVMCDDRKTSSLTWRPPMYDRHVVQRPRTAFVIGPKDE